MKKLFGILILIVMIIGLVACGNNSDNQATDAGIEKIEVSEQSINDSIDGEEDLEEVEGEETEVADTALDTSTKILVAYFSMPETDDPNNMTTDEDNSVVVIEGEVLGNTQYMAYVIQEYLGADIFRIEREEPYPTDHATLLDVASVEQSENARPTLAAEVENIEQYDVIFVGYPNWWADMPQPLYTFLEEYDLSGKTIVPFNTHDGSGFSDTISTITNLVPNATVEQNGLSLSRNAVEDSKTDVESWLQGLGY